MELCVLKLTDRFDMYVSPKRMNWRYDDLPSPTTQARSMCFLCVQLGMSNASCCWYFHLGIYSTASYYADEARRRTAERYSRPRTNQQTATGQLSAYRQASGR